MAEEPRRAIESFAGDALVGAGRVSPHRHFLKQWDTETRFEINRGVRIDGKKFFPVADWRAPNERELALLAGAAEDGNSILRVFTYPEGLRQSILESGLDFLNDSTVGEQQKGGKDPRFLEEVAGFLSFATQEKLPSLECRILVAQPDQPSASVDPASNAFSGLNLPGSEALAPRPGNLLAVLNLSDERSFLVVCNLRIEEMRTRLTRTENGASARSPRIAASFLNRFPSYPLAKIALEPNEGCFLDSEAIAYDLCTVGMADMGLVLLITRQAVAPAS